jgi:hypothetical protein
MPKVYLFQWIVKVFSVLMLLIILQRSDAQVVTVSEEINMSRDANFDLLGLYDGRILMSREVDYDVSLLGFDNKLFQVMDKSLSLESKKPIIIGVSPGKKTIDVFYANVKKELITLFLRRFDSQGNLVSSMTIKEMSWSGSIPKVKMTSSLNKNWVVLHSMDNDENLQVLYIDMEQMLLAGDHYYSMNNLNFRTNFKDIIVTNTGEMLIVLDNTQAFSKKMDAEIIIIHSGIETEQPKLSVKNFTPYNIRSNLLKLDESNRKLVLTSLYADRNTVESPGIVLCTYDLQKKDWGKIGFVPFELEIPADQRAAKRTRFEVFADLKLDEILIREDGGLLAFFEDRKEYERSLYQGRRDFYGMRFAIDYYYDDIYVLAVSPNGQLEWQKRLQKKQYSFDDDALYSSFYIFKTPSAARIIYNDEIKNENTVSEYILTGSGQSERRNVLNTNRQDLRLQIRNALQISPNEFIIPSVKRNRLKLVKVTYSG